ncbi:hypothetical protein pdam_00007299 [Pocillopora damicornis]|uniref:Afadin n=1 Tax=Pocillopora damicornis TaxID=46731 RepID=A0A3M6V1P8_POCDA|nr:hypothetical protein pdam_00007299 [Pocillopora damicornis]
MDGIRTRQEERAHLRKLIAEWNACRLDIFAISEPDENLLYRGVMRFYFQDAGAKMSTKCVRVSSTETADEVTRTLVEKFRPDMKMLSNPNYSLYEVHPSGVALKADALLVLLDEESRKLLKDDKPLFVQLLWLQGDREGRFLLKSDQEALITTNVFSSDGDIEPGQSFKRKLSKREKKELKEKRKEEAKKAKILGQPSSPTKTNDDSALAQILYDELPETSFTRSISNPEIVMKMRRQRKLERRLQEFQSSDGGTDSGGTLKIFAETLKPQIPYKTLLVSMRDPTTYVVKEALDKYGMEKENPDEFCLVMVNIPPGGQNGGSTLGKERVVHDEDNPLAIAATWPQQQGHVVFHLRRRANLPQYRKQKRRSKSPSRVPMDSTSDKAIGERLANSFPEHLLPYLRELSSDGRELDYKANIHRLPMEITEVGSEKSLSSANSYLELFGSHILPRHCVITNMDGIVSVERTNPDAEIYVDGRRVYESTKLSHGSVIKFGRLHTFKFCDPAFEDKVTQNSPVPDTGSISSGQSMSDTDSQKRSSRYRPDQPGGKNREYEQNNVEATNHESGLFETTFGIDGEIETYTSEKPGHERQDQPPNGLRSSADDVSDDGMGDKLPARLEFRESGEDAFFAAVVSEVNGDRVQFKLAPTYTLYMCCRYRISPAYREELSKLQRGDRLSVTVQKIANMVRSTVEENSQLPSSLAFWMANSSELLHFLKQDIDVSPYLKDSYQVLAQSVQMAFRHLVQCVEQELRQLMSAFLDVTEDADMEDGDIDSMMDMNSPDDIMGERSFRYGPSGRPMGGDSWLGGRRRHGKPTVSDILYTLASAMSLLRRCRVNAALTIQVFAQLFHYINMWIFNKIVLQPQMGLCTRDWGYRLSRRLARVETWAQKQGLEMAAECHLCRVAQAAHLLQAPKNSHGDINSLSSACYKLNSVQLRALLENYRPAADELNIPRDLIDSVVAVAENTADEHIRNQGQAVTLEEDPQLQLPFLLPEDRYSCEVIRGVPSGLKEFLSPLAGIGGEISAKTPQTPEIMDVSFYKGQGGMGLSIVAAKGVGQDKLGIYIKQVVKDGPAAKDGRLQAGDQLLSVNGESLVGVPQEKAAELMVKSGPDVTLRISKQGAIYHGLATLLSQPSPMVTKEPQQKLVAVDNEEILQASPTISEQEMQRSPGRWLQKDRDQSYRQGDEERGRRYQDQWQVDEDRRRRDGGDERRRYSEGQRRMEEEERMQVAERERRYREGEERRLEEERRQEQRRQEEERRLQEERRLEEQRRRAEEQRRLEEERRRAEEQRRLEEEQRRLEEERRRAEEQRRLEEERRRSEEQRRLEEERRRAEELKLEEERRREEERRLEEQRLYAEEQKRIEEARLREERRIAEEQRRLDEERRREEERRIEEQRRFGEERRRQEVERKRAEDALKTIGEHQRRQKTIQVEPVRSPYRVRFESEDVERERQRSPLTVKVEEPEIMARENRNRIYSSPTSPGATSPGRGSPREEKSPDEPPSSPIRVDSRNSRYGRYIMVKQGAQATRPGETEQAGNLKPNERDELNRWQREEARTAEEKEGTLERRDRDERAWRHHLERQRKEQEEKERLERERQEREQQERQRRERDRQALESIERSRAERERQQKYDREREERERAEEERIMNQMQREELNEQRERENHLKQLEEEQKQLREMEQSRLSKLSRDKGSKEFLDTIEALSADEVEREFQKRLEAMRNRRESAEDEEERTAGGLVSVTRVKYYAPDKEERMERGKKIDLLLQENIRREKEKKEAEKRRQQKEEEEEILRRERQQRRLQQFELDREQQKEAQRKIQEHRDREQEEWLKQQREKRDQQRMEQEKQRQEKKMQEEEERNRKRLEIQQRRDQEERLRWQQNQKLKEEEERLRKEEEREAEARREFERQKQQEEQKIVREKEAQLRKQQLEDQMLQEGKVRKPSVEEHVNELKSRATADYERRRKLIDEEITRRRSEPPSALRNSGSNRPKKQVSFSNVATEIREPASPTYVVGTASGYTARVTPAPSVRYVNTRAPSDSEPDSARPPLPDDDDDLPPPPPPPPPPDELLEDDNFPPPPPPKSLHSSERFAALSGERPSRNGGYTSRVTISAPGTRDQAFYPQPYSNTGVPLRQPPITSSSAYPSYATYPRRPRPVSYPAAFEMNQPGPPPAPTRYGSQDNVLDGPPSRSQSQYAPKPARLDSDELNGMEMTRGRLGRMSLTDEEKSEGQFVSKKPEKLDFKDKLKMFNKDTPEEKIRTSRWEQGQLAQMNGDLTSP